MGLVNRRSGSTQSSKTKVIQFVHSCDSMYLPDSEYQDKVASIWLINLPVRLKNLKEMVIGLIERTWFIASFLNYFESGSQLF